MNKKKSKFIVLVIFLILVPFVFGVFFENKKFYPYLELKSFYYELKKLFSNPNIRQSKTENIDTKNLQEFNLIDFQYENLNFIETSTIKLEKKEISLKNFFPKSNTIKARGGICSIDDFLIVVSASGEAVLINDKTKKILFFNLEKYFKTKNLKINIVQDIYCKNKIKNNIFSFLINIQVEEDEVFIEDNYQGKYTSNIYQIDIIDFNKIKSDPIFKSKKHGINWAGRIVNKGNFLYISFSSRDSNKEENYEIPLSQDLRYLEGKIIEIDLENNSNRIYSIGHRNPQGLLLTSNNQIISTEHGPRGGDELNIISEGKNYGWPLVTHGTTYESFKAYDYINAVPGRHDGYAKPVFSWTPGIGISNLIEIKNFDERWNEDILISSLKNMSLYRVRLNNNSVIFSERIWVGSRIRDISINNQGIIYLWTDDKKIVRLNKNFKEGNLRSIKTYDITRLNICLSCHYLNSGDKPNTTLVAPTLSKIFERNISSDEDFNYSEALKNIKGKWNTTNLAKYLLHPQKFAPGTYKSYKVNSQSEALKIIEELEKLSESGD